MCLVVRRFILNPIIDWQDEDIWEFIKNRNLPINPLYGQGWNRVGCIGCPLSDSGRKELDLFPKYKEAYYRAAKRHIEHRRAKMLPEKPIMESPEIYFDWWLRG
jgi:phosphoadenosine phosphosulfate reductase